MPEKNIIGNWTYIDKLLNYNQYARQDIHTIYGWIQIHHRAGNVISQRFRAYPCRHTL